MLTNFKIGGFFPPPLQEAEQEGVQGHQEGDEAQDLRQERAQG